MGVQREPGQKGVSWSNIAVGEYTSTWIYAPMMTVHVTLRRWYHEHGMNFCTCSYVSMDSPFLTSSYAIRADLDHTNSL